MYVFPTNIFSRGIWHVVKLFLDPVVREKVVLLGGGRQPPGPPAYIAAENVPERVRRAGHYQLRAVYFNNNITIKYYMIY